MEVPKQALSEGESYGAEIGLSKLNYSSGRNLMSDTLKPLSLEELEDIDLVSLKEIEEALEKGAELRKQAEEFLNGAVYWPK